jgi:hypothetical protein
MILVILTVTCASLSAVLGLIPNKRALTWFAFGLFLFVTFVSAVYQKEDADKANAKLNELGDLTSLDELAPNGRFFVQVSAGSLTDMQKVRTDILNSLGESNFAKKTVLVAKGGSPYRLIFGQNLTAAQAAAYTQFAILHAFNNGPPRIQLQPAHLDIAPSH